MSLDCLILPAPDEAAQRATTMIDKTASTPPRPSAELAKGLAEYRQRKFTDAAARLERVVDFQSNTNAAMQARLILAMARSKLGQADAIRIPDEKQFSLYAGDWNEQMTTALFAREARSVIVK
jgi:hypothetical protein